MPEAMADPIFEVLQKTHVEFVGNATLADTLFLKFSIQSRISLVVTAAFNVFASTAVVVTVLYDSWRVASLNVPRRRIEFLTKIPTAHAFANVLALATMVQGSIFIAVQTMGLQDVLTNNCRVYSQVTWTSAWVIGYTILIFSSEAAFRSIHPACSGSPCRSYPSINWIVVLVFLILTWLPSYFRPVTMDICAAELTQWMEPWADIGTGIASALVLFFVVNAVTLSWRLRRPEKLSFEQSIAARNMVYYLLANAAIFAFTLPFWVEGTVSHSTNIPAMMMSIVINLFGIVNGVLFVLLRASGQNIIFRSANPVWFMKPPRRYSDSTDSTDFAVARQMIMPVDLERNNSAVKLSSKKFIPPVERESRSRTQRAKSRLNSVFPDGRSSMERLTENDQNRQTFLSFSSGSGESSVVSMTNIDDFVLLPPQPYFNHRRRSSDISAATVQIGLCLSSIPMPLPSQPRQSSRLATVQTQTYGFESLPPRFSSASNMARPMSRRSLDLPLSIHPLQINPPSAASQSSEDVSTLPSLSNATYQPPQPSQEPLSPTSQSERTSRRWTEIRTSYAAESANQLNNSQRGLPSNPKQSQGVPRRGRKESSAWPLPERFSLLPDKTYSQTPWI